METKSDWIPATVDPVRAGPYECDQCTDEDGNHIKHYWCGAHWYASKPKPGDEPMPPNPYWWKWRGLSLDKFDASVVSPL